MVKMTQPKLYPRGNKLWIRFSLNGLKFAIGKLLEQIIENTQKNYSKH